MRKFQATYEIITPESAERGDVSEHGYQATDVSLREALRACGHHGGGCWEDAGRWWNTTDYAVNYHTGEATGYAIHPPDIITPASYRRITRILTGRSVR